MGSVELQQMHRAFSVRDRPTREVVRCMHGLILCAENDLWFSSPRLVVPRDDRKRKCHSPVPREQFNLLGFLVTSLMLQQISRSNLPGTET